jgi:glycosyltransferase involved in cell wall biosynthesis
MVEGKKVIVVLPAYNAEETLEKTFNEIPFDIVDDVVLVDDNSVDNTYKLAQKLKINHLIKHNNNRGYGANQKSCYDKALSLNADIIIMLHPDYQYTPKLIHSISYMIAHGIYDVVLGSRILGKDAIKGGMPTYKYLANRVLTLTQNILVNQKLSEYHTGYRGYNADVLRTINYSINSDDFVFDNQVLAQIIYKRFRIGEISCPTKYFAEASSINLKRSIIYGVGVLKTSFGLFLTKTGLSRSRIFLED